MRLINSPITKNGEVKYFELFKIFVLVMGVVMSFSFISNQVEIENYTLVRISLTILMMVIVVLFGAVLTNETFELIELIKTFILPLLNLRYNVKLSIKSIFSNLNYFINNSLKPRSHFSRLCVMRC
ncbi:hypothetical protein KQ51_00018 [Candidatus Izimaplasma bacterium HR1]|jgi:hypothetical protein|uniref:hypothetical protein n=1 Tax=Candidatus Izimoplasma sp. HR1 TaxID=1541959 RepID=UPI0004F681E6|nr:hypothetical protein KQ51_00018 [Candidatus Izimaplasma bacterium HR1]